MEEGFPASMLVVAGLLRVAGAPRSESLSSHTTDQSSVEDGLVTPVGHLVPMKKDDAIQVTLQFDSFTFDFPNDGISHPHEIVRTGAEEILKERGQLLTFPGRQPRKSQLTSLEGAILDRQSQVPSTSRPPDSTNMLIGLSKMVAEATSQPEPLTTFLLKEDGKESATGHDLSGKQSSSVAPKAAEMDLPTTLPPDPSESAEQKMIMDSSPSIATSPGKLHMLTLSMNVTKSEVLLDETMSSLEKEILGTSLMFLPSGSQQSLVNSEQTQLGLGTSEIPSSPELLPEAQFNFPVTEEHLSTQQPSFTSSPYGKMARRKAVGLQRVENPALPTPSQSHTPSSLFLLTPETLSSGTPPWSAMPGDVSPRDQPRSVFQSQFAPSSKPGVSDEAEKHFQESMRFTLPQERDYQVTIQPSDFKSAQRATALIDSQTVSQMQGTTPEISGPAQEQPQVSTVLATVYGKAQGTVLNTSPLGKANSSHTHPTTLRMAASSHIQPLSPASTPDAPGYVTQAISEVLLPSAFPPHVHGQQALLRTSIPPPTESPLSASASTSVPTQPLTPGVSATVVLDALESLHTVLQHESKELSAGTAASVPAELPTLGGLTSAYAGLNLSAATDSPDSTPRPAELSTLVHGRLQGRAFGMIFQAEHQTLGDSVSAHDRATVPETNVLSSAETGTAASGLDVPATALHDHTKLNLSADTFRPFYAMMQSLPAGVNPRLQPAPVGVPSPSSQVPVMEMTLPTHFKSQNPGASASFIEDPHLFRTPDYARAKQNTEEILAEGSLPVSTEAKASTPMRSKAPQVSSVYGQTQNHLSYASAQFETKRLAQGDALTTNTPASSPVQPLGHLRLQPLSTSAIFQTELQPQAASTSVEATTPNSELLTTLRPAQQLPATLAVPGMHQYTAKEEEGKSSLQSSVPPSQPGIDSTPLPGVSAARASQKPEGRDQNSATPSLGNPTSQTAHHKRIHRPKLSSVNLAEPFPSLRTTPVPSETEVQDLLESSEGFIMHLLNQSDVALDRNLDSAVASSYPGIPSSLQYLSFSIRSADNMICLQPAQNATPPSGEPNASGPGVTDFQEMLVSSTFLGLSHSGASGLRQMSPSSVILVKPMFVFLPADEPEGLVIHSAEEENELPGRHSFTKAAVLRLVASSYEQRVESNSTNRQPRKANILPTNRPVSSGSVLSSPPEHTTKSSRVGSTTLKANPFPDQLREEATTRTKSLESKDQEKGFSPSTLDPPKSERNNRISLSVEHHVSATLPKMVSVHQRRKMLPPMTEVLNSPPAVTSLHSMTDSPASPALPRTSRSENKPEQNMTEMRLLNEDHHPHSVTLSSQSPTELFSISSAGNMDLPLGAAKSLTQVRAAQHHFLITKVARRQPSEIQYVPSTVSDFLTFPTEPTAVNYTYSEAFLALPTPMENPSYFVNSTLAKVSKSHVLSPFPLKASERPRTAPSPSQFLAYTQEHTSLSEKHLEGMNLQIHSRAPVPVASQVSTNPYFATSVMKDNQTNLMLTGKAVLPSTDRQTDPTVPREGTGKNMRHNETHSLGEASHLMPTELSTDSALLVPTKFSSAPALSGGPMGSTGFQRETHKSPLTIFHSLLHSSTYEDTAASPAGGKGPPLEMPHSDLPSLQLRETTVTDKTAFFSPLIIKKEVIQHDGRQEAEVASPFPTSAHLHPQPVSLERGHRDSSRLLKYKQKQNAGSFMPSPGSMSSSLGSSTVAKAPTFPVTTLFPGGPSDEPLDKVLEQTSHLQSLPLAVSETTLSLHTQVLTSLESLSDASEGTTEGDFMVEVTRTGEFDRSYLHIVGEQATVVTDTMEVTDTTEEEAKNPMAVLQPPDSSSSLLDGKMPHRRPTRSDNVFLDGFAVVSDDSCGSGNYTTEMSLQHPTGQPTSHPSRPQSFLALIVLQGNSSLPTLAVKSCCVTPTTRPAGPDAACCFFPRTSLGCEYIQLHQNSKPQTASFTIQPFQMLNCSVTYLHCELTVCMRNRAGCEQNCSEDRESHSQSSGLSSYQTLHNLISFGPIQKTRLEFASQLAAGELIALSRRSVVIPGDIQPPPEESEMAMMFPVLLGSLAGIAILLTIFVFICWRHKIRMATKLEGEEFCPP